MTVPNERSQPVRTAGFEDADDGGIGEIEHSTAITYSRGVCTTDNTPTQHVAPDFDAFCELVLADRAKAKHRQWIAAPFGIAPDDAHHTRDTTRAAIGRPHRCKACVRPRRWLGFDVDKGLTAESFHALVGCLHGFSGVVWTTHGHKPDAPRCRIVLELDLAAPRAELIAVTRVQRACIDALMREAGYEAPGWDETCDRPEQPLFLPPVDAWACHLEGRPLALGELLANVEMPVQHAMPTAPPAGVRVVQGDAYAVAALKRACETISAAPVGVRNNILNREAYSIGGFVGAGRLNRDRVLAAVDAATHGWDDPPKTRGTIRGSVASGAAMPRFDGLTQADRAPANRAKLRFVSIGELIRQDLRPNWLIKGLLERDCLGLVYGASGGGKSYYVLDQSLCISAGRDFFGRKVTRGPVLYIAGEGVKGLRRRALAWSIHHGVDIDSAPLHISTGPTQILDDAELEHLRLIIAEFSARYGQPVLIVIDTVARNYGPGDENSTEHMSRFVNGCGELQQATGACVLGVHHTSKGDIEKARGNGSLRAAMEWEYSCAVRGPKLFEVSCTKAKDYDEPPPATYRIHGGIDIGQMDDDGEPVTNAVLVPALSMKPAMGGKSGRGKNQTAALRSIHELSDSARKELTAQGLDPNAVWVSGSDWRARCIDVERIPRQRFTEVARSLRDAGMVVVDGERVRLGDPEFDRTNG